MTVPTLIEDGERDIFGTPKGAMSKTAPTDVLSLIVMMQAPVPLQSPYQPEKTEPADGAAARVIDVFAGYLSLQVVPQSIPEGALVTMPVPSLTTVRVGIKGAAPVCLTSRWNMGQGESARPRDELVMA